MKRVSQWRLQTELQERSTLQQPIDYIYIYMNMFMHFNVHSWFYQLYSLFFVNNECSYEYIYINFNFTDYWLTDN